MIDADSLPPNLDHRVSSSALLSYETAVTTSSIFPRGNNLGRSAKKHVNGPLRRKSRCGQFSFIPPLFSKPVHTFSSSQDKFTVIAITTRNDQHVASLQNRKISSRDFLLAMAEKSPEYTTDNGEENNRVNRILQFTFVYVIIPFLPAILLHWENDKYQFLKQQFTLAASSSATAASAAASAAATSIANNNADYSSISTMYNDAINALFVLLVSKRLALYFMATMATLYAGWRASRVIIANGIVGDDGFTSRVDGPGKALDRLNAEILRGQVLFDDDDNKYENDNNEIVDQNNLFTTFIDENDKNDDGSKSSTTKAGNALALLLPVGLATSLGGSYMFLSIFNGKNAMEFHGDGDSAWNAVIQPFLVEILPLVASLPSLALCLLFTATEFRWAVFGMPGKKKAVDNYDGPDDNSFQSTHQLKGNATFKDEKYFPSLSMGNILALMYVAGAYFAKDHPNISLLIPGRGVENSSYAPLSSLDIWPLQNGVNIALATTVTRALAPFLVGFPLSSSPSATTSGFKTMDFEGETQKKLRLSIQTIALASLGVSLFDAISVFGTVVNAASIDDMIASSSNLVAADTSASSSISVMEAVARSKLSSPSVSSSLSSGISPWQPGLLEIILGGRVTDALGLGDVVFPSCLVAWAFVADAVAVRNRHVEEFENNGEGKSDYSNDGAVVSVNCVSNKGIYLYPYTTAAVVGYILGSFLTEIVGSFSLLGPASSGLPALVFLIPCMLLDVVLLARVRGEIEDVLLGGGEVDDSRGG